MNIIHSLAIRRIDEIAAHLVVRVQELEARLLAHPPKTMSLPFVTNIPCTKDEGRYPHSCARGQDTIDTELSRRITGELEERHDGLFRIEE